MKKHFCLLAATALASAFFTSCGSAIYMDATTSEESSLNLQKITNEAVNGVVGNWLGNYLSSGPDVGKAPGAKWITYNLLSISPDGQELAYATFMNDTRNVMVRSVNSQGTMLQRTSRNISDFSWGNDGMIYFGDKQYISYSNQKSNIASVNAKAGSMMKQHTSGGGYDENPVLSPSGKKLFFTRLENSNASIWSLELENGTLSLCSKGYNACPLSDNEYICVRNSDRTSELWRVNFVTGQESLILSDKERGFTNPCVSPDGKWIVCQGNSISPITKKQNLDIFVVGIDGSNFMQMTFHPQTDCNPVWSKDGEYIYFISSRANDKQAYNIWKMKFMH